MPNLYFVLIREKTAEITMKNKLLKLLILCAGLFILSSAGVFAEESGGYIVKFKSPPAAVYSVNSDIEAVIPDKNIYKVTEEFAAELEAYGDYIEYAEPNGTVSIPETDTADSSVLSRETFDTPNDALYSNQWNMPLINADYLWKRGINAGGVRIGVIDSGDPSRHPDIKNNIVKGADFTGWGNYDIIGHSTFICGVIAADTNNLLGTAGMLTDCEIVPLRVFSDSKNAYISDIAKAINAAVYEYGCDVINLSLTTPNVYMALEESVADAVNNGVIVVAAAGNGGSSQIMYPAGFDGVIGVGAVNKNKVRYSWSQYNTSVDVAAPGDFVYSTYLNSYVTNGVRLVSYSYTYGTGTSYASPHVAAAAAVAKKYRPDITSDEFLALLAETSEHLGDEGKNVDFGYGLLDMRALVDALTYQPSPSETPGAEPSAVPADEYSAWVKDFKPSVVYAGSGDKIESVSGSLSVEYCGESVDAIITAAVFDASGDFVYSVGAVEEVLNDGHNSISLPSVTVHEKSIEPRIRIFVWDKNLTPLMLPFTYDIKQ